MSATLSFSRMLRPLEIPSPFPAGHHLVELPLLGAQEVEVVLEHVFAERLFRHPAPFQLGDRLPQRAGYLRQLGGGVEVSLKNLRRLDPVADAVEPGGEGGGIEDVGIGVRSGDAALDPERWTA